MICQSCQHQNLHGAIFCLNCGVSLLPHDRKRDTTAMLGSSSRKIAAAPASKANPAPATTSERRFRATVINNGRSINVPIATPVLIGRQDNSRGFFPDLDLNNDGGYDSGVSRRHARISLIENVAYVEDLESANGTFVNDQRLPARTPHRLQPTDELRLGSLILRIDNI